MKRKLWRRSTVAAIVGTAFAGWGGTASASGFQLQEQGASGLGVAYSGQAAAVHDASTAFWNPAGMSLLPGKQVTGALHYIIPDTKFNSAGSLPGGSTYNAFGEWRPGRRVCVRARDVRDLDDQPAVVGGPGRQCAVRTRYGVGHHLGGSIPRDQVRDQDAQHQPDRRVQGQQHDSRWAPALSYQRLEAELTNAVPSATPGLCAGIPCAIASPVTGKVEGDDWAWGWNLGAMFDFGQGTRVGLTYRSTIDYTIEGDLQYSGTPAPGSPAGQNVKADVELPDTFSIGVSHQFNPKLRMLADYTWTGWDSIKTLDIQSQASGASLTRTALEFKNSWRMGVGARVPAQPAVAAADGHRLRHGAGPGCLPDAAPAGQRSNWLSIGARYQPSPTLVVRLRLHVHLGRRRIEQPAADRR